MGWNSLKLIRKRTDFLQDLPEDPYVYFVHSYYLKAAGGYREGQNLSTAPISMLL